MLLATGKQISTPVKKFSHKRRCSSDCVSPEMHDLQPCKVRRNYLCKDCNYCTTNPREFLYHQRDFHGQKGNIHECPYCLYASPHSHKLNRHITVIHSASRMLLHSQPPPLNSMHGLPRVPPPRPHSLLNSVTADLNIPADLEIILVEDDGGVSTVCSAGPQAQNRSLSAEPSVVLVPIPPPPKLSRPNLICAEQSAMREKVLTVRKPKLVEKTIASIQEYSCSQCSFKSKRRILVQRHERVSHLKKKFFRCTKCNYVTSVRSRYTKHLRYHSMPYIKCALCDFSTPYKWNLDRHNRHHLEDGDASVGRDTSIDLNAFRCVRCSFLGSSGQSLNLHMLNHHGGKPRPRRIESETALICKSRNLNIRSEVNIKVEGFDKKDVERDDDFGKSFSNFDGVNGGEDKNSKDQKYDSEGDLIYPYVAVDENETKSDGIYTCGECKDIFSSSILRDRHMYECHNIDGSSGFSKGKEKSIRHHGKANFRCDKCSYKAKWFSELIKHKRVHSRDKPFSCSRCEYRCRWKGDMTRHMMRIHNSNAIEASDRGVVVKMEPINSAANNIESLLDQSMMVGAENELNLWSEDPSDQNNPLDLSHCGDELEGDTHSISKSILENEFVLAGGKVVRKKYQCPQCNFITSTPVKFHMHFLSHINSKNFMCSVCGYSSNWQWEITKHAKLKSVMDFQHRNATIVFVNEHCGNNYEKYEQYAVYETVNANEDGLEKRVANINKNLSSNTSLSINDGPRKVTYKCKYCSFKNSVKKTVMRHMVIHSINKAKRFWCGVCGQASNWKHVILRHCHHVHGTSGPILLKDSSPASPPNSEDVMKATSKNFVDEDYNEVINNQGDKHTKDDSCSTVEGSGKEKIHKCLICPYQCQKVFDLRIHSYLHRPRDGAIFKCMFCPFYVSLKRSWLNHMRLHVDRPQEYAKKFLESAKMQDSNSSGCESSQAGFKDYFNCSSIVSQQREISDGPEGVPRVWVSRSGVFLKMFKCRHCPHVSKKRAVIMTHEKMHRKRKIAAGKPTYKCPHCNYISKNAGVLTAHQKVHTGKDAVHSYICSNNQSPANEVKPKQFLGESSKSMVSSPSRLSATSTIEDGKLKIKITKVGENKNPTLQSWLKPVSSKPQKIYHSCGYCPAKFNKLHQMLSHRTFHGANLPWRCSSCNYAARHRPHLHKHERVHTPEYLKMFIRPLKRYKDIKQEESKSVLNSQTSLPKKEPSVNRLTQKSSGDRKHQCQMCPATFLKYSTLIYHMHLHNNNGKFKCPQCTYSVSNIGNLARHIKVHTGGSTQHEEELHCTTVAPSVPVNRKQSVPRQKVRYACTKCPAVFDKQVRFGVHTTLHGSLHRFRCDKCDYAVKFAAILTRHKALHEKELGNSIIANRNTIPTTSTSSSNQLSVSLVAKESMPMSMASQPCLSLTQAERQQLLLHNLQTKPMKHDAESVNELKKVFCCDRCPYINQRKDAVQSHLKRHIPGGKGSTMCPHCDYGTSIHSFLREHVKLHFKPSRNHLPEAFLKLDNFKIWVRSETITTLVFKHPLVGKEFDNDDIIEKEKLTNDDEDDCESICQSVEDVLRELVCQVEKENSKDECPREIQSQVQCISSDLHLSNSVINSHTELVSELITPDIHENHLSSVLLTKPLDRNQQTLPTNIFNEMVGTISPNLVQNLESSTNAKEDMKEFMEFAVCLGYSA